MSKWLLFAAIGALIASSALAQNNQTVAPSGAADIPVTWKTYFFGFIVLAVFVALLMSIAPVFSILCSAAVLLYLFGIIDDAELFAGLTNNGVLSIAMLYVVVHPVVDLPMMKVMVQRVLGSMERPADSALRSGAAAVIHSGADATSPEMLALGRWARLKICVVSMIISPFLENTPQTAMFTPLVSEHCRKIGLAPSQILMPMTFAVLLANYFPLGYSSNLIVSGLMEKQGLGSLPLWELAKVNLPLLLPVLAYLVLAPRYLLPLRRGGITFYARLKVTHTSPLVGNKVSAAFAHFFDSRTESSEKISVFRRADASTAVGKKLTWEKVQEPFSRLMVLRPGDDVVIGGLIATIGQDSILSGPNSVRSEEMVRAYDAPVLQEAPVDSDASEVSRLDSEKERIALQAAVRAHGGNGASIVDIPAGSVEGRLYDIILSSLDVEAAKLEDSDAQGSSSPTASVLSQRSFLPTDRRSHQHRIRNFCSDYGVMMMSLKVSLEGANLLKDDNAAAKCPNLVATTRLLAVPQADAADEVPQQQEDGNHGSPPASPRSRAPSTIAMDQRLLLRSSRKDESLMTWTEWHQHRGGRMFRVLVPNWFPLGSPETIEPPESPLVPPTEAADATEPHQVAPADVFLHHANDEDAMKKTKWKVLELPWWYEYLSLVIFVGIVIASFFDVKLSISCFVACAICVLMRLVSTKELVKALPVEIYLLVAFSFPLGSGMHDSGLASAIGNGLVDADVTGFQLLLLVGLITLIFTNMITAQGSVQVIFPLVVKVYEAQRLHPLPGIMMVLTTLATALCTPFAIASNAIIIVPGGYYPMDYFKFGAPLSALVLLLAAVVIASEYNAW